MYYWVWDIYFVGTPHHRSTISSSLPVLCTDRGITWLMSQQNHVTIVTSKIDLEAVLLLQEKPCYAEILRKIVGLSLNY
jgi:hypothetical protein